MLKSKVKIENNRHMKKTGQFDLYVYDLQIHQEVGIDVGLIIDIFIIFFP